MNSKVYRAAMSKLSMSLEEGESVLRKKLKTSGEDVLARSQKAPTGTNRDGAVLLQGEQTVEQGSRKGGAEAGSGVGKRLEGFCDHPSQDPPALARRINCLRASTRVVEGFAGLGIELHNYPEVYPMDEFRVLSFAPVMR